VYERFVGAPKRELRERMREPLSRPAPPGKLKIAKHILERLYGSERRAVVSPRHARAILFATAAASAANEARPEILARAANKLEVEPDELEESLFADLPDERRLGRADCVVEPTTLALRANLALAQGFLFRAARVHLELEGAARLIVRHAKLKGLIGRVLPKARTQDAILELSGPFALFRRTLLYGRALAELVPLLSWCDHFRLTAQVVVRAKTLVFELRTGDPVLPASEPRRYDSKLEERFARDFAKLARDWDVVREPEPIAAEGTLIFPDFALQHRREPGRRWLLEIVGFWTHAYLEEKLRRLRLAAIPRLILCVDEERNVGNEDLPRGGTCLRFCRRIDAGAVLEVIERTHARRTSSAD
jgi:predicted nuclease of restriction endonuclease-like RecB superfamily